MDTINDTPLDPLDEAADPRLYVPLPTSEQSLAELVAALDARRSPVALLGAKGMGKTQLLFELARREESAGRIVRLSRSFRMAPEYVVAWLLHRLFGKDDPASSERDLFAALRARGDERVVLIVDDADRGLPEAIRELARVARLAPPQLVVVAASVAPLPALEAIATVALPARLPDAEIAELSEQLRADPALSARLARVDPHRAVRAAEGSPLLLKRALAEPVARPRWLMPTAALSALALGALGIAWLGSGPDAPSSELPAVSAPAPAEPAPSEPSPAARAPSVGAAATAVAPAELIRIQVNARPWARIAIDGIDLGPTPLSHRLPAGAHELRARFPDGKTVERRIDVSPDRRLFALP